MSEMALAEEASLSPGVPQTVCNSHSLSPRSLPAASKTRVEESLTSFILATLERHCAVTTMGLTQEYVAGVSSYGMEQHPMA
jgi:hypothetical protein